VILQRDLAVAFTLIFILLMLSLCVIFYCEMYAIEVDSTYPTVDCDYITERIWR